MDSENNLLDSPPTAHQLRHLAKNGLLDLSALDRALKIINHTPNIKRWENFLSLLFLILGTGLIVSGIFFFFAFNWADMGRFFKLGLLEAAVVIAVGLAFWRGLDRLSGQIALTAAGLMVGALVAVYGQIYQTGADSYRLFLTWAGLITGWVLISKFTTLWLVWVALLNLSLIFYWTQVVGEVDSKLYLGLFLLNGGGMLVWEISHAYGVAWLKSRWPPRLLSLPAFVVLVQPTIIFILSAWERSNDPWLFLMFGLFIVAAGLVLYLYSQRILDLFMLTVAAFSLIIVFNTWLANLLESWDEFLLFFLSLLFIGQAVLVVTWLRRVSKLWEGQKS